MIDIVDMIYRSSKDRLFTGAYCPHGSLVPNGSVNTDGEAQCTPDDEITLLSPFGL